MITRAVGGPIVGTEKEKKENFHVQFLHMPSHNYLILFIYPPHPSWEEVKHLQRPLPGNMLVIVEPPAKPEEDTLL